MKSHVVRQAPRLRGVVFDMEGTLIVPKLDFAAMYSACGVPMQEDLLQAVLRKDERERTTCLNIIEEMEAEGRRRMEMAVGVKEFANWLKYYRIPTALVTRNTNETVEHFHSTLWEPLGLPKLSPCFSRDRPANIPRKPHPAAMNKVREAWGMSMDDDGLLSGVLMVGDSHMDIQFGKAGQVATALVDSGRRYEEEQGGKVTKNYPPPDFYVTNLAFLPRLLWKDYTMVMPEDASLKNLAPPQPTTRLGIAAKNGDTEMVNTEIRISVVNEDNEAEKYTNSPIIWAADGGHTECVRAILEAGRNVNRQGYLGATAVSRAARKGHAALLDLLLSNGADPEIPNLKLQFPLHFAAFNGHEDCVQVLLRHKASPWVLDRKGRTPAQDTANENNIHILNSSAGM